MNRCSDLFFDETIDMSIEYFIEQIISFKVLLRRYVRLNKEEYGLEWNEEEDTFYVLCLNVINDEEEDKRKEIEVSTKSLT